MEKVEKAYRKNPNLKKEDVKLLQDWLESQHHLPKMSEYEVIWFLQSCYSRNEAAKVAIDNFFTVKTMCPEILRNHDPKPLFKYMDIVIFTILPKKTPDGSSVLLNHLVDLKPELFILINHMKLFDMVTMLDIYMNGPHEGFRCCFDMKDFSFSHIARMGIITMRKFLFYLQEAMPVRLKGLHFINITPVMDKFMMIVRPFLKKEVLAILHLHDTIEDMEEFIPMECLPFDYGGQQKSLGELHVDMKRNLMENSSFFAHQDSQVVDESKRPGKPKNVTEFFGVEGTFKKLDLD